MSWTPNNIQYTINGLTSGNVKVVNPVGRDNGDYCGLLLRTSTQGGRLNEQLTIQSQAICRPCLRQIESKCGEFSAGSSGRVSKTVIRQRALLAKAAASNIVIG